MKTKHTTYSSDTFRNRKSSTAPSYSSVNSTTFLLSILPNLAKSRSCGWKYDYLAILFVVLPYTVSIMYEGSSLHEWPSTVSNTLMIVEVSWIVKFLMSWPASWTDLLIQSRKQMLNYIKSLELGNEVPSPESALNYEVSASTVQTVKLLRKYQNYGFFLEGLGVLASLVLFAWVRTQLAVTLHNQSLTHVNLVMFVLWGAFKWVIHFVSVNFEDVSFEAGAFTLQAPSPVISKCIRADYAVEKPPQKDMGLQPVPKAFTLHPLPKEAFPEKHLPLTNLPQEVTVSITPFPLSIASKRDIALVREPLWKRPKILSLSVIKEVCEPEVDPPVSLSASLYAPDSRLASSSENMVLAAETEQQPTTGAQEKTKRTPTSNEARIARFLKQSRAKIYEYMQDQSRTSSISIFSSLHLEIQTPTNARKMVFGSWDALHDISLHNGVLRLGYLMVMFPVVMARIAFITWYVVPVCFLKLWFAFSVCLARFSVRILVIMPMVFVAGLGERSPRVRERTRVSVFRERRK